MRSRSGLGVIPGSVDLDWHVEDESTIKTRVQTAEPRDGENLQLQLRNASASE